MSLSQAIADLAVRVGQEVSARIRTDHPGLARAWGSFRRTGGQVECLAAHNAALVRVSRGRYRIDFTLPLEGGAYVVLPHADLRFSIRQRTAQGFEVRFLRFGCLPWDPASFDFILCQ